MDVCNLKEYNQYRRLHILRYHAQCPGVNTSIEKQVLGVDEQVDNKTCQSQMLEKQFLVLVPEYLSVTYYDDTYVIDIMDQDNDLLGFHELSTSVVMRRIF